MSFPWFTNEHHIGYLNMAGPSVCVCVCLPCIFAAMELNYLVPGWCGDDWAFFTRISHSEWCTVGTAFIWIPWTWDDRISPG